MSLFQRNTNFSSTAQYYTLGQQRTVLLVGLGNIGKEYNHTRHNVGFLCLDAFIESRAEMSPWQDKKDLKCHLATGQFGDTRVIAIKPTTYMNLSGEAVQAASHFYKITPSHILVIHDEIDIPFGQIRLRSGGSAAGHNGIKSVTNAIGEDYGRVRIGIGPKNPPQMDSADFVLQKFSADEQKQLTNLTREVSAILSEYTYAAQLPHETRSFIL
ncbi:MAG TPA: aminoacyl-tRNA hydrolase [Candidatus Saccharimonadales bacterium]|nr:aminoacyl-tRNA hydrolase [Candidatus Saccharimonadales bacterium]